ncbi:hypothetical protein ACU4GA_16020 [Methylobacterium oryzae CBMB20]
MQDRTGGDTLPITHELLAAMLGVQRRPTSPGSCGCCRSRGSSGSAAGASPSSTVGRSPPPPARCHARVRVHCEAVLGAVYGAEDRRRNEALEALSRTG